MNQIVGPFQTGSRIPSSRCKELKISQECQKHALVGLVLVVVSVLMMIIATIMVSTEERIVFFSSIISSDLNLERVFSDSTYLKRFTFWNCFLCKNCQNGFFSCLMKSILRGKNENCNELPSKHWNRKTVPTVLELVRPPVIETAAFNC